METKDKAPIPKRRSLMRHVYETVDSLGGGNLDQIIQHLPAALNDGETMPTREQVRCCVDNSAYRGYLTRIKKADGKLYWMIASADTYQVMRSRRRKQEQKSRKRCLNRKRYAIAHAKPKVESEAKPNGVLAAMDATIKSLSAEERVVHNKIDRLRKMRSRLVDIGV